MTVVAVRDTRRSVASWCRRHTLGGEGAIATARKGDPAPGPAVLSRRQELELIDAIRGRYPDDLGLGDQLWSRQSITDFARQRFDVNLDPTDIAGYLLAWGLGPREPTDRACTLCVDAVSRWLDRDYPDVVRQARSHQAELYWIGRTRLQGASPYADVLSAASTRGQTRFVITPASVDPSLPREFLLRLSGRDGHTVHAVIDGSWTRLEWPRRIPARIVLHALPSCGRTG
ncbi:winged helix-turn-helix domain-containing protein [Plantactinospora sp. GCM10030261]|uniref:winged helix-turn-helix domain-containing protein n=1 Tax=Plantactinospora sp. GCM10030261 TaxID=3273420 RepID=UPI00360DB9DF